MVCLGLKPGAGGWLAQTNPVSYGGTPILLIALELDLNIQSDMLRAKSIIDVGISFDCIEQCSTVSAFRIQKCFVKMYNLQMMGPLHAQRPFDLKPYFACSKLKKWAKPGLFLFIFVLFTKTINDKSIDGVLGTRTQGGRMVGADKSTEVWRHPVISKCILTTFLVR